MPVVECDPERAREALADAGVEVVAGNTDHEVWRAEHEGATAVAYEDKVVVQGRDAERLVALLRREDRPAGSRVHVYFDGACRGNPGPGAIGWVLVSGNGIVTEGNKRIGDTTNNRAEYDALEQGIVLAAEYGFDEVVIRGDAELVVRQVRGEWETNDPHLRERRVRIRELLDGFEDWSIEHVPRELNSRADELATEALDDPP